MKIEPKCCGHKIHAQIEYMSYDRDSIESLVGLDVTTTEGAQMARDMLEEWLTAKRAMNAHSAPDHFIVYRNWPGKS